MELRNDKVESSDDDSYVMAEEYSSPEDIMEPSDNEFYVMVNAEDDSSAEDVLVNAEEDSSGENTLQSRDDDNHFPCDYDSGEDSFGLYERYLSTVVKEQLPGDSKFKPRKVMELRDIIKENALHFLSAKSLARFRLVSKEWDQWIGCPLLAYRQSYSFTKLSGFIREYGMGNPTFVTLNDSYGIPSPSLSFLPERVKINSSCNGLLLCQSCGDDVYYICNPANKEWKVLPPPNYYYESDPAIVLAFEPCQCNLAADYHLICAGPIFNQPIINFEIYSSNKRSWCCSDTICTELQDGLILNDKGYYIRGCAYWETSDGKVLAFDVETEVYGIFPLPSGRAGDGILTEMHGEICYVCVQQQLGNKFMIDLYSGMELSSKNSVEICFETVKFTIGKCRILSYGEVITILVDGIIYAYHTGDQNVEVISKRGNSSRAKYLPYVNSMVSF